MSRDTITPPTAEELAAWEKDLSLARACALGYDMSEQAQAASARVFDLAPRLLAALTAERERVDWLQRHYVGADFAHGSPDGEISVMLIQLPEGARFTGDLRVDIDAARTPESRDA